MILVLAMTLLEPRTMADLITCAGCERDIMARRNTTVLPRSERDRKGIRREALRSVQEILRPEGQED